MPPVTRARTGLPAGPAGSGHTGRQLVLLREGTGRAGAEILRQAGIPDRLCGLAGDLFGLYLGAAVHESEGWQGTQDFGEEQSEMMRQWFMSMPPDQFPNLLALADQPAHQRDDDVLARVFA